MKMNRKPNPKRVHSTRRRLAKSGLAQKCRHPRCTIRGHLQPLENFRNKNTDICIVCEETDKRLKKYYVYDFNATHPHPPIHKALDAFIRGKF